MAVRFIRNAEQLKILDAGDETVATIRSPGFAPHRPHFEAVKFDLLDFANRLEAVVEAGRDAYTARASGQDEYEAEAGDVRRRLDEFSQWLATLHAAARALQGTQHPLADKVMGAFKVGTFEGDSAENVRGNAPGLLRNIDKLGDLSDVGLTPAFIDRGRALVAALDPERQEAWSARMTRMTQTGFLHVYLDQIVDLLDQYARYREFAMAMSGAEIPDLGLSAIRSSMAGRSAPSATEEAPETPSAGL